MAELLKFWMKKNWNASPGWDSIGRFSVVFDCIIYFF